MRVARLYVGQQLASAGPIALDAQAAHHITRVLRLRPGAALVIFDGSGRQYEATLLSATRRGAEIEVGAELPAFSESPLAVTLVQGVSRGERMDLVMQKATELGVTAIIPVLTERSVVRLSDSRAARRTEHWRRIITSACEQSGRAHVPALAAPLDFDEWLAATTLPATSLVLQPGAVASIATLAAPADARVTIVIGPEGGLTPRERELLLGRGCVAVGMGPRILRTETAALAALALVQASWGDLGGGRD